MPCHACCSEFGIFKKEVACKKCGFSFCTKCCSKKSISDKSEQILLCIQCFNIMSGNQDSKITYSPPAAHKKRMEKFANRSLSLGAKTFENEKDREIADRLQKLKRERMKGTVPSQNDIEERLAKLKGMDPSRYTAPPIQVFRPSDRRSSTEQAYDLMTQLQEEVALDDQRVKPEDEIASRLAMLRDQPIPSKTHDSVEVKSFEFLTSVEKEMDLDSEAALLTKQQKVCKEQAMSDVQGLTSDPNIQPFIKPGKRRDGGGGSCDSDMDEEAEADKIIERLLATDISGNEIEDLDTLNGSNLQSPTEPTAKTITDEDAEEFPWCVICTENATIRCFGCENDLYCMRCFKECHDSFDIKDHKTCPFLCPKDVKNI